MLLLTHSTVASLSWSELASLAQLSPSLLSFLQKYLDTCNGFPNCFERKCDVLYIPDGSKEQPVTDNLTLRQS